MQSLNHQGDLIGDFLTKEAREDRLDKCEWCGFMLLNHDEDCPRRVQMLADDVADEIFQNHYENSN